jgi:cob(I)alamin adenosyltransferase
MSARSHPLILVNTGHGKGKSSSSFGVLMRAWHQGWSCGVYQFMKSGKWRIGEKAGALALSGLEEGGTISWFEAGDGWSWTSRDIEESADLAREGWEEVKRRIADETYDFLLLDEITYPMNFGWIDTDEVADVLANRPGHQHIFVTGRDCPPQIVDVADLVSEITKIKHPYDAGIKAQPGIEW